MQVGLVVNYDAANNTEAPRAKEIEPGKISFRHTKRFELTLEHA